MNVYLCCKTVVEISQNLIKIMQISGYPSFYITVVYLDIHCMNMFISKWKSLNWTVPAWHSLCYTHQGVPHHLWLGSAHQVVHAGAVHVILTFPAHALPLSVGVLPFQLCRQHKLFINYENLVTGNDLDKLTAHIQVIINYTMSCKKGALCIFQFWISTWGLPQGLFTVCSCTVTSAPLKYACTVSNLTCTAPNPHPNFRVL